MAGKVEILGQSVQGEAWERGDANHADGSSTTPLLGAGTEMESGRAGQPDPTMPELLKNSPEHVMKYIEEKGVQLLGSFRVKDATVLELLDSDSIMVFGRNTRDIDWEAEWRAEIDKDDKLEEGWSAPVEVEAYVVAIRNAAHPDDAGLVNPILKRFQQHACSLRVFGLPAVRAVCDFKWHAWAKAWLYYEMAIYLVWLLAFQVFMLLFQDEDLSLSLKELLATHRGQFTVAFEVVALVAMVPFLYIELCTVLEYNCWGWWNVWNLLDTAAYFLQVAIVYMHLSRKGVDSALLSGLIAVQILLLWVKLQYFARVLQQTDNPFMDTVRAVVVDVKWFLFLLLLTIWGFASAFYILFRRDQEAEDFSNIWRAFLTMISVMLGGFEVNMFLKSHNPWLSLALLLLFVFVMSMVLLNCLIAIMGNACNKVADSRVERFYAGRAQIVDELESTLPRWLQQRFQDRWHPTYVHFLKVNPASADAVLTDSDKVVQAADKTAEVVATANKELVAKVTGLETQLQQLQAAQQQLLDLHQAMAKHIMGDGHPTDAEPEREDSASSKGKDSPTKGKSKAKGQTVFGRFA